MAGVELSTVELAEVGESRAVRRRSGRHLKPCGREI
jgi:hypothetical protein